MAYSKSDKRVAREQLEADLLADLVTPEEYGREEAMINAGSSRSSYLPDKRGLIERAAAGDTAAIIRIGLVVLAVIVMLVVVTSVLGVVFGGEFGGEGGFEEDDD